MARRYDTRFVIIHHLTLRASIRRQQADMSTQPCRSSTSQVPPTTQNWSRCLTSWYSPLGSGVVRSHRQRLHRGQSHSLINDWALDVLLDKFRCSGRGAASKQLILWSSSVHRASLTPLATPPLIVVQSCLPHPWRNAASPATTSRPYGVNQ